MKKIFSDDWKKTTVVSFAAFIIIDIFIIIPLLSKHHILNWYYLSIMIEATILSILSIIMIFVNISPFIKNIFLLVAGYFLIKVSLSPTINQMEVLKIYGILIGFAIAIDIVVLAITSIKNELSFKYNQKVPRPIRNKLNRLGRSITLFVSSVFFYSIGIYFLFYRIHINLLSVLIYAIVLGAIEVICFEFIKLPSYVRLIYLPIAVAIILYTNNIFSLYDSIIMVVVMWVTFIIVILINIVKKPVKEKRKSNINTKNLVEHNNKNIENHDRLQEEIESIENISPDDVTIDENAVPLPPELFMMSNRDNILDEDEDEKNITNKENEIFENIYNKHASNPIQTETTNPIIKIISLIKKK